MQGDKYLHVVLTVIAVALVYLCVLLTPLPVAFAQGARTPGESTGPAEMVIVGWKLAAGAALPVEMRGAVAVTGDVKVVNDVRVNGRVQTEQAPRTSDRVVLAGWEEDSAGATTLGSFTGFSRVRKAGLPVAPMPPQ